MKKLILSTTALVMLSGSAALALDNLDTDTIVAEFSTAQRIEIKRGLFRTRVEVLIDGQWIEVVYDNATVDEVSREVEELSDEDLEEIEDGFELEVEIEDEDEDDLEDEDEDEDEDDEDEVEEDEVEDDEHEGDDHDEEEHDEEDHDEEDHDEEDHDEEDHDEDDDDDEDDEDEDEDDEDDGGED